MHYTSNILPDNSSIAFDFNGKNVTKFGGLASALSYLRKIDFFSSFIATLDEDLPRNTGRYFYNNEQLLEQLIAANMVGFPDFQDATHLQLDPLFRKSVSRHKDGDIASAPTLCRFYEALNQYCLQEQEKAFEKAKKEALETAEKNHVPATFPDSVEGLPKTDELRITSSLTNKLNRKLLRKSLEILKFESPSVIMIDVDGTPIKLHGNQQQASFDGHYRVKGYLPIFVTINDLPGWVQCAAGAAYGAQLATIHIETILEEVKKAFPEALVVVRADTGFGNQPLIDAIHDKGCRYIIGENQALEKQKEKLVQQVNTDFPESAGLESIPSLVRQQFFAEMTPPQGPKDESPKVHFRTCGILRDYQGKSWNHSRTVAYRLEFKSEYLDKKSGLNFRFVQTNLTTEELQKINPGRGIEKGRTQKDACFEKSEEEALKAIAIYENVFCDRGNDERMNSEWKSGCFASKCSCSDFFANFLRMIVSAIAMLASYILIRKVFPKEEKCTSQKKRNSLKANTTRAHQAEKLHYGHTVKTLRTFLLCVSASMKVTATRVKLSFAPMTTYFSKAMIRLSRL